MGRVRQELGAALHRLLVQRQRYITAAKLSRDRRALLRHMARLDRLEREIGELRTVLASAYRLRNAPGGGERTRIYVRR